MSKLVLIDCDGVLADFQSMAEALIAEITETKFDSHHGYNILDQPELKQYRSRFWDILTTRNGVIRNIKPYDYALEMVEELRGKAKLIACTSLVSGVYPSERTEWLIHEMGFDRKDIIIGYQKHLVFGDMLIDDKPENVVNWQDAHPNGTGVLWQPPKARSKVPSGIFSTSSLEEVLKCLE